MAKDRGIEHADKYFGNFIKLVADAIKKKGKVRILDAGCGYGVAMMGFVKRFGDKVEIVGYNYSPQDGNLKIMKENAVKNGIFTKEELKKVKNMPKIIYCDANEKLPFKSSSFDFIYSIASIYLYDRKMHFLQECNRLLKKKGLARISPSFGRHFKDLEKGVPPQYQWFYEIWDKGKEIQPEDYLKKIKGIKIVWENKGKGDMPLYIQIKKQPKLDFKLRFVASVDFNFIWEKWGGVKAIYTTQLKGKFKPRYKVDQ